MNIDNLAFAIQKDFDKVDEKFGNIDERFGKVDKEFEKIDKEFGKVHAEIAEIKNTMGGLATKDELKLFKNEILAAIAKMDRRFSAYMARTNEDISKLQGSDRDFDVRLRVVEKRG